MSVALLDAIRQRLVSLKMPCALEELDTVVRRIEVGQFRNAMKSIGSQSPYNSMIKCRKLPGTVPFSLL